MNDSPSVRQIQRGSYAPHYRKSSAWIFLSSDDSKSSASSFPSGGRPEVSVDFCLSLLTSGEAARDDAGAGDEIPQGFLIGVTAVKEKWRKDSRSIYKAGSLTKAL